jgi:hypothetical protein
LRQADPSGAGDPAIKRCTELGLTFMPARGGAARAARVFSGF